MLFLWFLSCQCRVPSASVSCRSCRFVYFLKLFWHSCLLVISTKIFSVTSMRAVPSKRKLQKRNYRESCRKYTIVPYIIPYIRLKGYINAGCPWQAQVAGEELLGERRGRPGRSPRPPSCSPETQLIFYIYAGPRAPLPEKRGKRRSLRSIRHRTTMPPSFRWSWLIEWRI